MNILCIGDVVGSSGCAFLRNHLPYIKKIKSIDMVIANGENSSDGNGILPGSAEYLFDSGVNVITLGNHTYRRKEIYEYLDEHDCIIRPYNFPSTDPGHGIYIYDIGWTKVAVINLMGEIYMDSTSSPFSSIDSILSDASLPIIKILDFHAEATSEKIAMFHYLDGKVSAIFGTHTHVQTADETISDSGTGFITDVGMTGPINSVLGVKPELIIQKLKTKLPVRFDNASGPCKMDCIIYEIDNNSGKCSSLERLSIR
jgi:metallophosphoesterase (TIGR00282 family)